MNRANYRLLHAETLAGPCVIRDLGPWDQHPTVTNDAEAVVQDLVRSGSVGHNGRLLYYDSDGRVDEIVVRDGQFAGFRAGPAKAGGERHDPAYCDAATGTHSPDCCHGEPY